MSEKISKEEAEQFKAELLNQINEHWSEWDQNGNGVVDLSEATPVLGPVIQAAFGSKCTEDDIKAAFTAADTDKSQGLTKEELHAYCVKAIDAMTQ